MVQEVGMAKAKYRAEQLIPLMHWSMSASLDNNCSLGTLLRLTRAEDKALILVRFNKITSQSHSTALEHLGAITKGTYIIKHIAVKTKYRRVSDSIDKNKIKQ